MPQLSYSSYHAKALPGQIARFHHGFNTRNYLNAAVYQISELTVTTAAAGEWTVAVLDTVSGITTSKAWTSAGTDAATTYQEFVDEWNADPVCRVVARAYIDATSSQARLEFNIEGRLYTPSVTPAGAGAASWAAEVTATNYLAEFGTWAVRAATAGAGNPADDETAISLASIPDAFATIADVVGVIVRSLHHEQKENPAIGYDHYPPGNDVPVHRRADIWVPVVTTVRPGDPVEIHNTSGSYRNGWTTTGGAGLVVPWAEFLTVAGPGELAVVSLTKD